MPEPAVIVVATWRAEERARTAYPCSLRVCLHAFQPVLVRPVFSLFMRVSVDRGCRFVHCVLVRICPVAVNPSKQPRMANLLLANDNPLVAGVGKLLPTPHILALIISVPCPVLTFCTRGGLRVLSGELRRGWITRRRFLCKTDVADDRGSAESTKGSPDVRLPPPCRVPCTIHRDGYPFRANTCSVDSHR
jgi:hypothetical protein